MKKIPFFANLADGTHCYQAALKMILTHWTGGEPSFDDLDRLSGKREGKWTWPTASLIWLMEQGFELKLIETFSFEDFAKEGKNYLVRKCGQEVADAQEQNSDLPREQELAVQFVKKGGRVDFRIPEWKDLENLFKDDYLMICNINANCLYNHPGYSGHFVVPVTMDEESVTLHDPGLPPAPFLKVSREQFEKAWAYPTPDDKNILGIRKSPPSM